MLGNIYWRSTYRKQRVNKRKLPSKCKEEAKRWNRGPAPREAKRSRLRLKCDGTRAETIFRLSAKRASPFKSAGTSVQSTTGSRGVRISGSNAGYTMFRGSVKSTGYPFHSPVSFSLSLPCVTVCHHVSTGLYIKYDSFPWPPLEPALSIVNDGLFFFCLKRKISSKPNNTLSKNVHLKKKSSVVQ